MRASDLDILIVPGLFGSAPGHWQNRWLKNLSTARLVEQADWSHPRRDEWVGEILRQIALSSRPVAVVAHSLGVLAAASAIAEAPEKKVAAAFLVAPADPDSAAAPSDVIDPAFKEKAPRRALEVPGVIVASRNDAFADFSFAARLAVLWGLDLADAGDAGHINAESGHGPWPEGLMRLAGLLSKIRP